MRRKLYWGLLTAVAACAMLPTPTAQLQRYKDWEKAGNAAAIEAEPVNSACNGAAGAPECGQLQEIRARACLTLVRADTANAAACPTPTDTARDQLDCAAAGFAAARQDKSFSPAQQSDFTIMRARSLYCLATFSDAATGVPLAQAAGRELASAAATPANDQLAAAAALNVAFRNSLPANERCAAARQAQQLAVRGLAGGPDEMVRGGLLSAQNNAGALISRLGCGGA